MSSGFRKLHPFRFLCQSVSKQARPQERITTVCCNVLLVSAPSVVLPSSFAVSVSQHCLSFKTTGEVIWTKTCIILCQNQEKNIAILAAILPIMHTIILRLEIVSIFIVLYNFCYKFKLLVVILVKCRQRREQIQ